MIWEENDRGTLIMAMQIEKSEPKYKKENYKRILTNKINLANATD